MSLAATDHAPLPVISAEDLAQRLIALEMQPQEAQWLRQAWDGLADEQGPVFEAFHAHIQHWWKALPLTSARMDPDALRQVQYRFIRSLFCAPIDAAYVQERLRVGQVHHRIGLDPHWYLQGCHTLLRLLLDVIAQQWQQRPGHAALLQAALQKRFMLDMGLVMNAYVCADRDALARSNRSLVHSQMRLQQAQELAGLACWEMSLPDGPLQSCDRARALLHLPCPSATHGLDSLRQWVHPQDRQELDATVRRALRDGGTYDVRYRIRHPAQPVRMLRERGRIALHGNGGFRIFATLQDISEQVSQLSRIEQLALYDDLTGLPNRANLMATLESLLAIHRQGNSLLSVLFVDLDDFKDINDTLGHAAGDAVLQKVAQRLRDALRADERIARLGGDEFVVVLPGVDRNGALAIARRLGQALAAPLVVQDCEITPRASIGLAVHPQDGDGSELLLRNADTAMYAAKRQQRGVVGFESDMHQRLVRRVTLSTQLARAIQQGSLALHFQPQVCLPDGRLLGAEALLRWQDSLLGRVAPSEFIAVAESRGLIGQLGHWVAEAACRQLVQWEARQLHLPGRLAINVSPRELDDPGYAQWLIACLDRHGLSPQRIALELTETVVMCDSQQGRGQLALLREAGFGLVLDDFGMGYSSLTHLRDLPVEGIKLDRSFVAGMLEDAHDRAIVVATLAMARSLGLGVTAEGVEQAAQAEALAALGCLHAQGFHFARPVDADTFLQQWLARASGPGTHITGDAGSDR